MCAHYRHCKWFHYCWLKYERCRTVVGLGQTAEWLNCWISSWIPQVELKGVVAYLLEASMCVSVCAQNKSQTYQDPGKLLLFHPWGPCRQRSSSLCCLSHSLALPLGLTRPPLSWVWSLQRWRSLKWLGPPRASSVSFASVAGVALLLCANSALIQKLFYAVKGTCDRQSGGGGEERRGEGGEARHFLVTCPLGHVHNNSSGFVLVLLWGEKMEQQLCSESSKNEEVNRKPQRGSTREDAGKDFRRNVVTDLHFVAKQLPQQSGLLWEEINWGNL